MTRQVDRLRLLWVAEKQFDVALSSSTWTEMMVSLQGHYDVQFVTGYRHKKVQPDMLRNRIIYYRSVKTPVVNCLVGYIAQIRIFRSVYESFRPDIILFNCTNPLLLRYAESIRRRHNVKLILDVRTVPVNKSKLKNWVYGSLLGRCLRYAAKHFDGITYITTHLQEYCTQKYGLPPHTSAIWTSGVNPDVFVPAPARDARDSFTILYHGSIAHQRRIDNVIRAMSLLKDIPVRLALLGHGNAEDDLRETVERLKLGNRITFCGNVCYEDVPQWIASCDVGIIPLHNWLGWNVSSPIKLFEYLSCGKPVVVTDIPAHRAVLGNSGAAFWAAQASPQDISEAIRNAYGQRQLLEELGKGARSLILEAYTWEQQASKLRTFIEDVLHKE